MLTGKKASLQRERKLLQRLAACEEELRQLKRQASGALHDKSCISRGINVKVLDQ